MIHFVRTEAVTGFVHRWSENTRWVSFSFGFWGGVGSSDGMSSAGETLTDGAEANVLTEKEIKMNIC